MKNLLLSAALIFSAGAAAAQAPNCAPRDMVVERLAGAYGESRQAVGLLSDGNVLEVWASDTGDSTWTIAVTLPNGLTCLVASGGNYQSLNETVPSGDPA